MEQDWVKIYTTDDFYKAEVMRQALTEEGIEAVLMDKRGFPYRIGEVELFIHRKDFNQAIELIVKME